LSPSGSVENQFDHEEIYTLIRLVLLLKEAESRDN
jgi:hypothetical protein